MKKNLKIFKSSLLTKTKVTLLSLGLMTGILAGCGKNNINNNLDNYANSYTVNFDDNTDIETLEDEKPYTEILAQDVLNKINSQIDYTEDDNNNFKNYVSNIDVHYENEDWFDVDKTLNAYDNIDQNTASVDNYICIKNNQVNADDLYNIVTANNSKGIANTNITPIDNSKLKDVINIIASQVNKELSDNINIDLSILDYNLSHLQVGEYSSFGNAYIDMENPIMAINYNNIASLQKVNSDIDVLTVTIKHETDHLMQVRYSKSNDYNTNMGISYSFNDIKLNSLNWKWFYEGSAEKLSLEKNGDAFVYQAEVRGLESLTLATILNDKVDQNDIEQISLSHDLNKLFNQFETKTQQEKEEIVKMMFSYDLAFYNTDEYKKVYEEKTGKDFDVSEEDRYRTSLLGSVGQTLTKTFYSNLSQTMLDNKMNVKDVFSLISLFETEMNRIIHFDSTQYSSEKIDFINTYSDIQNEFFDNIAKCTNISSTELRSLYCEYHNNYAGKENYDFDFMTDSENDFLNYMSESRKLSTTDAIVK